MLHFYLPPLISHCEPLCDALHQQGANKDSLQVFLIYSFFFFSRLWIELRIMFLDGWVEHFRSLKWHIQIITIFLSHFGTLLESSLTLANR